MPGRSARLGACSVLVVLVFGALACRGSRSSRCCSGDRYAALGARADGCTRSRCRRERGRIFDRDGRDLACRSSGRRSTPIRTLVADPALRGAKLAPVVGVERADALRSGSSDTVAPLRRTSRARSTTTSRQRCAKLGLPGVGFVPESARQYPAGSLAALADRPVGGDGIGLDGLEAQYDDVLAGKPGELVVERDQQGRDIPDTRARRIAARRGTDIVLTLDEPLQYETEQSLVDQVTATAARAAWRS